MGGGTPAAAGGVLPRSVKHRAAITLAALAATGIARLIPIDARLPDGRDLRAGIPSQRDFGEAAPNSYRA